MMTPVRHAIILAAGQGRRLWPYTQTCPKCLLDVGRKTILEHQVDALRSRNIDHITVVIGYLGYRVRDVLGPRVEYVENPDFVHTSSMYSLWLAREAATEGCVILNADVLFHGGILQALQESPHPDALAVDFDAVLVEEETKVLVTGERVRALSKTLPRGDAENVGMLKFSPEGSRVLFAKIQELLGQNYRQVMVPYALNAIAPTYFLAAVPVHGLPWIEIDFPEDYQRACDVIYPAIHKDRLVAVSLSAAARSAHRVKGVPAS
jgi:choline kinase